MLQVFVTKLFEHRILTSYREKIAAERQRKLLEELEEESNAKKEKESKKIRDREKKLLKKKEVKQAKLQQELILKQQEEERAKKEEEERLKKKEAQKLKAENDLKTKEKAKLKNTKPVKETAKPVSTTTATRKPSIPGTKSVVSNAPTTNNIVPKQTPDAKPNNSVSSLASAKVSNSNALQNGKTTTLNNSNISPKQELLQSKKQDDVKPPSIVKNTVAAPLPASVKLNQQPKLPNSLSTQDSTINNDALSVHQQIPEPVSSKPSAASFKTKDIEYRDWSNSISQPRYPIHPATVPISKKSAPALEAPQPITRPTTFQSPSSVPPIEKLGSEALLDDDEDACPNTPMVSYPFGPPQHHIHNTGMFTSPSAPSFGPDMAIVEQIQEVAKHAYLGLCIANGIQFNSATSSAPFFPFAQVYHRVMSLLPDPSLSSEEFFHLISCPINGFGKMSMGYVPHNQFEFQNQADGSLMLRYWPASPPPNQLPSHNFYPGTNSTFHAPPPPATNLFRPMNSFAAHPPLRPPPGFTSPNLSAFSPPQPLPNSQSSHQQFAQGSLPSLHNSQFSLHQTHSQH
jgi:hypothetical protein